MIWGCHYFWKHPNVPICLTLFEGTRAKRAKIQSTHRMLGSLSGMNVWSWQTCFLITTVFCSCKYYIYIYIIYIIYIYIIYIYYILDYPGPPNLRFGMTGPPKIYKKNTWRGGIRLDVGQGRSWSIRFVQLHMPSCWMVLATNRMIKTPQIHWFCEFLHTVIHILARHEMVIQGKYENFCSRQ